MQLFLSKKSKLKLQVFGWYQIIGGIFGVLLTFYLLAHTEQITGLVIILYLIAFGLYSFSIYCGRLLLTDSHLKGLNLSIINQAFQIINFILFGYGFMYVSGMMILAGVKAEDGFKIAFNFSLTSTWHLYFASEDKSMELGINFLAIYLVYFTDKLRTTIKSEKIAYDEAAIADANPILAHE